MQFGNYLKNQEKGTTRRMKKQWGVLFPVLLIALCSITGRNQATDDIMTDISETTETTTEKNGNTELQVTEASSTDQTANTAADETENQEEGTDTLEKKLGDIDGNGVEEYATISGEYHDTISLFFNGGDIWDYEYEIWLRDIGEAAYIDLDHDGEKEIFFSFSPDTNDGDLEEFVVLKKEGENFKAFPEIHDEKEDYFSYGSCFPVRMVKDAGEFEFTISCEGLDKKISYDFTNHYEQLKEQDEQYDEDVLTGWKQYQQFDLKEGDEAGWISPWGIWSITCGSYGEEECLIASQGLDGCGGRGDLLGTVNIYFDYDAEGNVRILDMEFEEFRVE